MTHWIFAAAALQFLLLALLGRTPLWRATGVSVLIALAAIYVLWRMTDGGQSGTEAWLVLTSLPLAALGAFNWRKPLGKLALVLGVVLTAALLLTWYWASSAGADDIAAIIIYATLVLVAMVALFMIGGVLGMRLLVERTRND
ncbi:MAG: hypothetical protein KDI60_00840 [Xanthomonadales bacterium]|nr:hypothetical protein [Xanthomonadales bacterium]MCB1610327.1 hypothetical protein [Xanthomonadales bacterium]